jgi:hypothetical protein
MIRRSSRTFTPQLISTSHAPTRRLVAKQVIRSVRKHTEETDNIDPQGRDRRFTISAIAAALWVVSTAAFAAELSNDNHWPATRLLIYNAAILGTAITAIGYFIAAIATPKREPISLPTSAV